LRFAARMKGWPLSPSTYDRKYPMTIYPRQTSPLVLEVLWEGAALKMSVLSESEFSSSVRHYGKIVFNAKDADRLSSEISSILNRGDRASRLDEAGISQLEKTGQLLWDHLLTREAKEKLNSAAGGDLILCLDEELIGIPWELLHNGRDFLCLTFNLGRVIRSVRRPSPLQQRNPSVRPRMLIVANPTSDLRSAYAEGVCLRRHFDRLQQALSVDFKSTQVTTLYLKKNLRDYDIVHFAGHCEYSGSSSRQSGWVLSDGVLNIQDIMLLSETAPLPGLIFSNACSSARHPESMVDETSQRKTYDLASAFLFAGVRHYIGSIWRIEDTPAEIFAREFYNRLTAGESLGGALRSARRQLIRECGISCIAWAGYILYGDPSFRFFRAASPGGFLNAGRWKGHKEKVLAGVLAGILLLCSICYATGRAYQGGSGIAFQGAQREFNAGNNQQALKLCSDILKRNPEFFMACRLMGDAYQRLGKRREALKAYFDYAFLSERQGRKRNMADAYIAIGWTYYNTGEYEKAQDFYRKAAQISSANNDKLNEAIALRKLAVWNMDKGNNEKALELLTKSSEINRERSFRKEHKYNLACDYFDLGLLFLNKDDLATARIFYTKSLDLFRRLKIKEGLSDFYFNLGEVYAFEKQYQKAMECYLRGLSIDRQKGNIASIAGDYNMLGELCLETGDTQGALSYFQQALEVCSRIEAPVELAATYHNLASYYLARNQKNKAKEYLRQAQEIYYSIDSNRYREIQNEIMALSSSH